MPYGLIVLVAAIALAGVYVFTTQASVWSKGLVAALLLLSFGWSYGYLLQAALAVGISLYLMYHKSRAERS